LDQKRKLLVLSLHAPYDAVPHAGGKTHNYYLKRFAADPAFEVRLVTFANPDEVSRIDLSRTGIDHTVIRFVPSRLRNFYYLLFNLINVPNYFGKTAGMVFGYRRHRLLKELRDLRRSGYRPDVVLMEWTEITLMVHHIRRLFPASQFIASEHDVLFLRFRRRYERERNPLRRHISGLRYRSLRSSEVSAVRACALVAPHNADYASLLAGEGVGPERIHPIAPYFDDYSKVVYNPKSRSLFFFGAMDRPENWQSVVWFIEQVFPRVRAEGLRLLVVGSRPFPELTKFRDDSIIVTGYVQDIVPYLQDSLCMVASLVLGAGIKVKILEAMSAGLPVLTNSIGIEGIPARDGTHYVHCETPDEYVAAIRRMIGGGIDLRAMSAHVRELVNKTFSLDVSYQAYRDHILRLCNGGGSAL
jgi:glycosyltransferase involved in cell wall biosynthesis